jgi:hypothetical protein
VLLWRIGQEKENDPDSRRGPEIRITRLSTEIPPARKDSEIIQILATEHWSLLATRALTYQESLGRVNMFLAILSGAVIALALVAQADHFGTAFVSIAIFMLTVVLVVGVFTVARLRTLNREDYLWVLAMNRIRNAYLSYHPELAPHFTTSSHDDLIGALQTLGMSQAAGGRLGSVAHAMHTLPGMLAVIVASVAAAIGGLIGIGFGVPTVIVLLSGIAFFVIAYALLGMWGRRSFRGETSGLEPRFPTPPKSPT